MLATAARSAVIVAPPDSAGTVVVARVEGGRPAILAAEANVDGHQRLLLFPLADAGSLTSAALFAAAARATSLAPPSRELEVSTIADADLARWRREPASDSRPNSDDSDGRWFWIVALALLALEFWLRRERTAADRALEIAHDRAA
jgi:hypothetical protein